MTRTLAWIYVLLNIVMAVLSKEVKSVLNPIFNDFRLLELDIKALFAASKIECVAICAQTSGCMAIQFNTNSMECRCFDRKFISMDNATYGTQNGFLYYDITTLIPWVDVGPFYLYVTPGSYICSQGPDVCISLGEIMAEFNSTDEMNQVLPFVGDNVFVGGRLMNGSYYWRTTGQEINPSLWVPGQPDLLNPCVQIWRTNNGLDDVYASRLKQILCQKKK